MNDFVFFQIWHRTNNTAWACIFWDFWLKTIISEPSHVHYKNVAAYHCWAISRPWASSLRDLLIYIHEHFIIITYVCHVFDVKNIRMYIMNETRKKNKIPSQKFTNDQKYLQKYIFCIQMFYILKIKPLKMVIVQLFFLQNCSVRNRSFEWKYNLKTEKISKVHRWKWCFNMIIYSCLYNFKLLTDFFL